ncbi:MAG: hypothetical protein ACXADY_03230 [Candidatus Hodarchaeales archaeon]|jgi:hypothetical protein
MFFPFSLKSASNWIDSVPKFLLTIPEDSKYVYNKEFHLFLASTLESFFPQAPTEFLSVILTILKEATEPGKYIILETLLHAETIWKALSQAETFLPALTELALSTDKLYSKNAAFFLSKLEDLHSPRDEEETISEAMYEEKEEEVEDALEGISLEKLEKETRIDRKDISPSEQHLPPSKPISVATRRAPPRHPATAPSGPPKSPKPTHTPAPAPAPASTPKITPPPPPSVRAPSPMPTVATAKVADTIDSDEEKVSRKRKKASKKEVEKEVKAQPITPPIISPETSKPETIHTHVHYYSRMNPRKTYPFTVTLSKIARKIAADKMHFLSGEEEKETRGKFELLDVTKRLIVEPLLSGCLVQPISQFVDPRHHTLPKELTFFITPLVEAGFRSTSLNGSLFVKDEKGTVLLKLNLPKLSVASHRVAQVATLIGTIGGGAMPVTDTLFGVDLQSTLAIQLAYILPQFAESFDMRLVITAGQIILFAGAIGIALLWWWKKGRAKVAQVAPESALTLQLSL